MKLYRAESDDPRLPTEIRDAARIVLEVEEALLETEETVDGWIDMDKDEYGNRVGPPKHRRFDAIMKLSPEVVHRTRSIRAESITAEWVKADYLAKRHGDYKPLKSDFERYPEVPPFVAPPDLTPPYPQPLVESPISEEDTQKTNEESAVKHLTWPSRKTVGKTDPEMSERELRPKYVHTYKSPFGISPNNDIAITATQETPWRTSKFNGLLRILKGAS